MTENIRDCNISGHDGSLLVSSAPRLRAWIWASPGPRHPREVASSPTSEESVEVYYIMEVRPPCIVIVIHSEEGDAIHIRSAISTLRTPGVELSFLHRLTPGIGTMRN